MNNNSQQWLRHITVAVIISSGLFLGGWRIEIGVEKLINPLSHTVADTVTAQLQPLILLSAQADRTVINLNKAIVDLDKKINKVDIDNVNSTVSNLNNAVISADRGLTATFGTADNVLSQINTALPDFLDCQLTESGAGNKNCLYIRYGDLSSSLDRTLSSVAQAAPSIAGSVKITAESVASATPEIAKSSVRIADHVDDISVSFDSIAADLTKWIDRLTAPATVKQQLKDWIKLLVLAFSRIL